ncbi:hypothetical protein MVES1_000779 [Malassezia vespertilionis]|uniref:uncharacterized protein n=1 Tax=Malassezia vespertilionis TaxID=2020962 RepID=UPI0024B09F6A|nr:uncharacterized protein MVES1_000779 [Malassezia vespertilionis]WFD05449.1 hypothetical protein MVES1_000779 [Malassezia vespertilionis]
MRGRDEAGPSRAWKRARADSYLDEETRKRVSEAQMYAEPEHPSTRFHWRKKEAQEKQRGVSHADAALRDAQRKAETAREVERLHIRRAQRERAQREREEAKSRNARNADDAKMADWVAKEDEFLLEQAKLRAKIRLRDDRAKPIDVLVVNTLWANPQQTSADVETEEEAGLGADLAEPTALMNELMPVELEELHHDIQTFLRLERDPEQLSFWRHALIVVDDKLHTHRGESTSRVDRAIDAEINTMLSHKTAAELSELQAQIRAKLRSGEPIEVEYWESLLRRTVVWRSIATLQTCHETVLEHRVAQLQRLQRTEAKRHEAAVAEQIQAPASAPAPSSRVWNADMEPSAYDPAQLTYEERLLPVCTLDKQRQALKEARAKVLNARFVPRNMPARHRADDAQESIEDALYRMESERAMGVEEEIFNEDVRLGVHPAWADKFRARKPRYFNRVHTGYEWNKYNQTHYDADNPPPKIVQGYKFNIFYPDLIDPTKAPTYRIFREQDAEKTAHDTVLLRFSAGPPYEDIAFRIVDREWEYSHRRGFRSSFDRGVLQLHFNFKRLKYRQ